MPIFDQYEVEPISSYSGSYASNYIVFLTSSIDLNGQLNNNSFSNKRVVAIDKASKQKIKFNSIIWDAETYLNIIFKNGYPGQNNRNINFFSDEIIYDSIVPNILEIHKTNGGVPVINRFSSTNAPTFILTIGENITASNDGQQISDNIWLSSFPFQSRYKNIVKYNNPTNFTDNLEYFLYPNWGSSIEENDAEYRVWKYNTGPYFGIPPYNAPLKSETDNLRVDWLVTSQSYPYGNISNYDSQYSSSRRSNNNLLMHYGGKIRINPVINSLDISIADKDILDDYFGFGNSTQNNIVSFNYVYPVTNIMSTVLTGSNGSYIANWVFSNVLRGFKYGLYSANKVNTKLTYRLGQFGQFRDLLEQRLLTATNNSTITKNLFFPIENTFVSGTTIYNQAIDYVTATNPDYNPYDSGIYDYYYRSGQPFFDRDNED